jgi:uncharacterized protein (DUF2461 family)
LQYQTETTASIGYVANLTTLQTTLAKTETTASIGYVAKVLALPYRSITLFKILREKKILQADNTPYQTYISGILSSDITEMVNIERRGSRKPENVGLSKRG